MSTPRSRIAVVGGGISGMACAHYLAQRHAVTLFEANERLGGHTATVDVEVNGHQHAIDTGFIVFNDRTYPHFQRLLAHLGVPMQPTEMSFSVHAVNEDFEYNGHTLNTLFAQRRNLLRPRFYAMLRDILRFNRQAVRDLERDTLPSTLTLGEYLTRGGYGLDFQRRYLLPMGAAIWSASEHDMAHFPLVSFVRFFHHHGLLSVNNRPQWYTLPGGSRQYIAPLTSSYAANIRLASPVWHIVRDARGVTLTTPRGQERFDQVVLACHSDQALAMLAAPSAAERELELPHRRPRRRRARVGDLRHEPPATPDERDTILRDAQRQRGHRPRLHAASLHLSSPTLHGGRRRRATAPRGNFRDAAAHSFLRRILASWLS